MRVIAFYSFFNVSNPRLLKERLNLHFLLKQIKGSIIVSEEGLNGTIAVSSKLEKKIIDYLMSLGVTKENIKISDFNGQRIFNEFTGEISSSEDGAGDVKYHLGASSDREFDGNSVHVSLTDNPSHLEAVNPVVLGQTRAK